MISNQFNKNIKLNKDDYQEDSDSEEMKDNKNNQVLSDKEYEIENNDYIDFFKNLKPEKFNNVKMHLEKKIFYFFNNQKLVISILNKIVNLVCHIEKKTISTTSDIKHEDKLSDKLLIKSNDLESSNENDMMVKENEYLEEYKDKNQKEVIKHIGKYDEKNKYIIEKFYNPFLEKMKFKLKIREDINEIKKSTKESAKTTYFLKKKKHEILKVANESIIYNNPSKS